MSLLLVEVADGIATLTLNRPEAMNALSRALRVELAATVRRLAADPAVRVFILTGAGERAFSAGLDLKELGQDPAAMADTTAKDDANPVRAIEECARPVIGAINGVAITGGFELALACDILLASTNARFADTHARVGILPGWGLSQKLPRLIGPSRAKELSFTGNFLDATTAERWGLVNRVVAPQDLMPAARRLAADIAGIDPAFLAAYKRLIDDGLALPLGPALRLETERSSAANAMVRPEDVARRRQAVLARGRDQQAAG
ncbi:MAG: enoyl-CoA hydratase [Sphingomonadaceae bacterium]|uniref:enoyl-CoA hydratase n=1 Tax=Thermaurantiacus sp. TaxID=2820283 RepID=UPI00298F2A11|nr:enoyl-CoA hydratase [Thermaurantiacus sp.]MCS6986419.1 enoyl-CoA hydratase [Sphingomonadaceae bacterium]MDW8414320.1 enoyl-CoA hydratase [Thermaurantiacus sp.]